MTVAALLAFLSAAFAALLATAVLWHERRSLAHWAFSAGMAVLAAESLFSGLAANSVLLETVAHWQGYTFLAMAFLPGFWLFFSLTYARGNYREFLARWQLVVAAAFIAPVVLALAFPDEIIIAVGKPPGAEHLMIRLGFAGTGLHLLLLLSAVLVLMNLERTFRASVGTMRWRIKFLVLGLGVLFVARAYTSSQALLFHGGELSVQAVNSGSLLVA